MSDRERARGQAAWFRKRPIGVVAALLAVALVGAALAFAWNARPPQVRAAPAVASAAAPEPPLPAAGPEHVLVRVSTEGEIERGRTLASSLASKGMAGHVAHLISSEMAPVFNFRYARPGDRFLVVQDEDGELVSFEYTRSPLEQYTLRRAPEGYLAERHEPRLSRKRARTAGVVASSLYLAVESLGEEVEIAHDFAEIFAWDVDFSRAVQPGDEFAILYERLYVEDEASGPTYVRPGRILAARYSNADDDYRAVYFESTKGKGGYYRPDGSSVERQFLRAPLHYRRISSNYTLSRLHPVLKVRRPHQGIDYAARTGTPVWSVGDGTVIFRGRSGGLGNLVKIRHGNGYVSYYGHLSRFAGVRVGEKVRQKQVLGYVGCTGLCTGPHLDYRLKHYGKYVNPASVHAPPGDPIPESAIGSFLVLRDKLLHELDPASLTVVTNEAL